MDVQKKIGNNRNKIFIKKDVIENEKDSINFIIMWAISCHCLW